VKHFMKQNKVKPNMSTLTKIQKKLNSEKGFSLLEILMSATILLIGTTITSQLVSQARHSIDDLETRAAMVDYLDAKFSALSEMVPFPTFIETGGIEKLCNSTCDSTACGNICANFQTDCPQGSGDSALDAIVTNHPNICYVQVKTDHNCSSSPKPDKEKQVCSVATLKKQGGGDLHEALTTHLFRA